MTEKELRSLLATWLFKGNDVYKTLDALSGGERARLYFDVLFQNCPNFLVLDEPTNHMDIRTREVLESALMAYKGTLLVVSHDRYFINRCTDHLLVFDREGIHYYPFDYDHYVKRQEQLRRYYELAGRKAGQMGRQAQTIADADTGTGENSAAGSGEEAQDQILRMRPEDQMLLEAFSRIPEKDRGYLKQESDDRIYESWKRRLMEEDLEKAEQEYLDALDQMAAWQLEHYEEYMTEAAAAACTAERAGNPEADPETEQRRESENTETGNMREFGEAGEPGELRELIRMKEERWTQACIAYDQEVRNMD